MKDIEIKKEQVSSLFETRFIKLYDLNYAPGMHYFDATRRSIDDLVAIKSDKEYKAMLPDAVSCFVILKTPTEERLLTFYEYRFTAGRYVLSIPAGLVDPEDASTASPLISAAKREIFEECGVMVKDSDSASVVSPGAFCTPGMSDETTGMVCAVVSLPDYSCLNHDGIVGSEIMKDFILLDKKEAKKLLQTGRDPEGNIYSMVTWAALTYFVADLWKED